MSLDSIGYGPSYDPALVDVGLRGLPHVSCFLFRLVAVTKTLMPLCLVLEVMSLKELFPRRGWECLLRH